MPNYIVKGSIELKWTMEVEAKNDKDAKEQACEIIEQEKLDAFYIDGVSNLRILAVKEDK